MFTFVQAHLLRNGMYPIRDSFRLIAECHLANTGFFANTLLQFDEYPFLRAQPSRSMSGTRAQAFDEDDPQQQQVETDLLGVLPSNSDTEETYLSRSEAARPTRTSSSSVSKTRRPGTTTPRDRADDELNDMLNAKHAGLETKWIILIVAVVLLLFTAMATAAFILRRCHRGRVLARKQRDEQCAREEQQKLADLTADERRQVNDLDDPYHMEDRQPYAVI